MASSYRTHLQERDGWFQFLFTIPKDQRARFGGKRQIRKSLGTRDKDEALIRLGPLLKDCKSMLDARDGGELTFERAKEVGGYFNFAYRSAPDFQTMEVQDKAAAYSPMLSALNVVAQPTTIEAAAITGAVEVPALPASKLYARFKEVDPGRVKPGKSPNKAQAAWRRYEQKISEFVPMMGDLDCLKINKKTVNDYRNKLILRVHDGEFQSSAANEYLEKFRTAWRKVINHDYDIEALNIKDPFDKVEKIDFKDGRKREDFTNEEAAAIRVLLDAPHINKELRALMLISENTGCLADELVFMTPDDFAIDHPVPHLKLRPNIHRKELKNGNRPRNVPLIGIALDEAKRYAKTGFPRYCKPKGPDKVSEHSAVIIKKVAPTKSFASYRHRIATLLRSSDCKDQFQDAVMGHGTTGMTGYYGSPPWLHKLEKALREALPNDA